MATKRCKNRKKTRLSSLNDADNNNISDKDLNQENDINLIFFNFV